MLGRRVSAVDRSKAYEALLFLNSESFRPQTKRSIACLIYLAAAILLIAVILSSHSAIKRMLVERSLRTQHSNEECVKITWSPNGAHLVLSTGCWGWRRIVVYSASGRKEYDVGSFYYSFAFWSPDDQYLIAKTCEGSHAQPAIEYTVYGVDSWEEICVVGSGDGMIGCSINHECRLPLQGDRSLLLTGDNRQPRITILLCDGQDDCLPLDQEPGR